MTEGSIYFISRFLLDSPIAAVVVKRDLRLNTPPHERDGEGREGMVQRPSVPEQDFLYGTWRAVAKCSQLSKTMGRSVKSVFL